MRRSLGRNGIRGNSHDPARGLKSNEIQRRSLMFCCGKWYAQARRAYGRNRSFARCPMRSFIVVPLIVIAGCSNPSDSQSVRTNQPGARSNIEAVPVATAVVVEKPVPLDVPAVGTAEAISSVQVRSQVTGQLGAIHFAEGQDVTRGQMLFELDPRLFQLALAQAEAVLAKDAARRMRMRRPRSHATRRCSIRGSSPASNTTRTSPMRRRHKRQLAPIRPRLTRQD